MFRKRSIDAGSKKRAKASRDAARMAEDAPDYPRTFDKTKPRRTVLVFDHDFGTVVHQIDLYATSRIDCYRAVADGVEWKKRVGWSGVLECLRKSFVRLAAI